MHAPPRILAQLLAEVPEVSAFTGDGAVGITALTADSRLVKPGSLFVALRGTQADGHRFIPQALAAGAAAVVAEEPAPPEVGAAWATVPGTAQALGHLASAWHGHPSRYLTLVGTTGTNGKTTVTTLLHGLLAQLGETVGLISTIENRIAGKVLPATHTTPDPLALHALLAQMRLAGCSWAFMEVSSHAVAQHRISGLHFAGGIFTNLTRDHLDYHKTFANYRDAKQAFFNQLPAGAWALANADDANGAYMLQNTAARRHTYALKTEAHYTARVLEDSPTGMHLALAGHDVHTRLSGHFNAYNLLAVYAAAHQLGLPAAEVLVALSALTAPRGRLEPVHLPQGRVAFVDYAHTPDALANVMTTLRSTLRGRRLLVVVGCGGDRDPGKRPDMGRLAAAADLAIFTNDNPRTEDPEAILDQMLAGVPPTALRHVLRITDRRLALTEALRQAHPGDAILVAGKGHETYQEVQGQRFPFDDRQELLAAANQLFAT